MKILKFVGHPIVVSFTFFMVLISGDHFGGFYLLYILMALPYGGIHSILGLLGVAILGISWARSKNRKNNNVNSVMNVLGVLTLYASFWFFFQRSWDENDNTFAQLVPLILVSVFIVSSLVSLFVSFYQIKIRYKKSI